MCGWNSPTIRFEVHRNRLDGRSSPGPIVIQNLLCCWALPHHGVLGRLAVDLGVDEVADERGFGGPAAFGHHHLEVTVQVCFDRDVEALLAGVLWVVFRTHVRQITADRP